MAARPAARAARGRTGRDRRAKEPRPAALTLAQRRAEILRRLAAAYPDARTALDYRNPYQLLVAVILSAQCTDARVNMVTPALFKRFPTVQSLASARVRDVVPFIKTCGLFATKAKNIVNAARAIVEQHGGEVPRSIEELLELPGVGRKTANVVLSVAFDQAAIAVDTHVFRVSNRLGLVRASTPAAVERQLMKVVPREDWSRAHHWLILHGRQICHARNPRCAECQLVDLCPSAKKFLP